MCYRQIEIAYEMACTPCSPAFLDFRCAVAGIRTHHGHHHYLALLLVDHPAIGQRLTKFNASIVLGRSVDNTKHGCRLDLRRAHLAMQCTILKMIKPQHAVCHHHRLSSAAIIILAFKVWLRSHYPRGTVLRQRRAGCVSAIPCLTCAPLRAFWF